MYSTHLGDLPLTRPVESAGDDHVYHLYVVRSEARENFRERLSKQGVGTLVHYERPIHQHPAYTSLERPGRLGISERLCAEVVSLPLYPELLDGEVEFVIDAVQASCLVRPRVAR